MLSLLGDLRRSPTPRITAVNTTPDYKRNWLGMTRHFDRVTTSKTGWLLGPLSWNIPEQFGTYHPHDEECPTLLVDGSDQRLELWSVARRESQWHLNDQSATVGPETSSLSQIHVSPLTVLVRVNELLAT